MKRPALLLGFLALLTISLVAVRGRGVPPIPPPVPEPGRPVAASRPVVVPEAPLPAARSRPPIREQLRRAGSVVQAYFTQQAPPPDLPRPQDWATNLPLGWFQLLIRAFPDEAFEIYSTPYLGDPDHAAVAYWALGELGRLRHEPTFRLFNAQLENADPVRARRALKVLANYEVPQLGPRILAVVPADPQDSEQSELVRTALRVAASNPSTDRVALDRLLDHFDARGKEVGLPDFYGTKESRLRAEALRSGDLAGAIARESDDPKDDLEHVLWAAETAVRAGRRELAPALQERIRRELKRLKEDERLDELDVLGAQAKGQFDVPSVGGLGGLEEIRAIAQLRRAVLDLGGTLSDEDRRWLDGLRLLRTPKEYLREAGLID